MEFVISAKFVSKHFRIQDVGKGGVEIKGVAFMTVLAVLTALAALESTLPSLCLSYKIQDEGASVMVSAVKAVSVATATPLKLNPPFLTS